MESNDLGKKILKAAGIALCLVAIVCNTWILSAFFSTDGDLGGRSKLLIFLFQALLLGSGFYLIHASKVQKHPLRWCKKVYQFWAIQVFNIVILFILLNVAGLFLQKKSETKGWQDQLYYNPIELYYNDRAFMREVYPGYSDEEIWQLINPPSSVANPVLEYMSGPHVSEQYNIGSEGIRFDDFVTRDNVDEFLSGSTWVFGGSTVFGAGVGANETIVHYLNELDPENTYLNFGFPSYHQNLEIDKLLLLLKKGYRPKRVLFVDGWNDLFALRGTNFHPAETPAKSQHAYGSSANMDNFLSPPAVITLGQLPLFRYLFSLRDSAIPNPELVGFDEIYQPKALYHSDPIVHYKQNIRRQRDYEAILKNIDFYRSKTAQYYSQNATHIEHIAAGFEFDAFVFLQPLGSLASDNPFLRDSDQFMKHPYYKITSGMLEVVRDLIRNDALVNFYDITQVQNGYGDCYVDAAHYNPKLCEEIAKAIYGVLREEDPF